MIKRLVILGLRRFASESLVRMEFSVSLVVGSRASISVGLQVWRVPFTPAYVQWGPSSDLRLVFYTKELGISGARLFMASNMMWLSLCHVKMLSLDS